ncbi:MAG: right-handed parallel beta-helix repeat-containing protein [Methanobrevibacter sp.]|nr:right-handed parallel beta-helix repeat-containing protein [Methanobrevibacter sp.]
MPILIIVALITISSVNAVDLTLNPTDSINDVVANINVNGSTTTNNTITLNIGTYNKATDINNIITIDNINLTITGNNPKGSVIIDAGKSGQIFKISGNSNITFINIVFLNGNTIGSGGAIESRGEKLTIIDCDFKENTADGEGGAINYNGNGLSVDNSNFYNNIAYNGGAIYNNAYSPTITKSNFTDNTANMYGGAIFLRYSDYTTISSCKFENNAGISREGGGIYSVGNDYVKVSDSTFINNSATSRGGGGIYNTGGDYFDILNCTFINNSAKGGSASGGAVCFAFQNGAGNPKGDYCSVTDCTFINNSAERYGGAIMADYAHNCTITNSDFVNNIANNGGSAVLAGASNNFSLSNSNFTNNKGTSVIFIYGDDALIHGCIVYNNSHGIMIAYGSNNEVKYNRIFNNTNGTGYNLDDSTNNGKFDFNWWGDNNPKVNGILNNYFVMNVINLTDLNSDVSVTFSYTFGLNTNEYANSSLLPFFETNVYSNVTSGIITSFEAREDKIFDVALATGGNILYSFVTDNEVKSLVGADVATPEPPKPDITPEPPEPTPPGLIPEPRPPESPESPEPTPPESPESPEQNDPDLTPESEDDNKTRNNPVAKATMKSTGMGISLMLIVLLSVLGVYSRKKY